ncbi:hypothetical protein ACFX5Q_32925 [Mesorhizobium sp. IMUNJ 23033]|uniref:hypothetical protein n=1 Tax=Mesorhizobium sp. IMUNJ 23033 TaxID=3378039 RepID=UPI00384D916E
MAELSSFSRAFLAALASDMSQGDRTKSTSTSEEDSTLQRHLAMVSVLHVFTLQDLKQVDGSRDAVAIAALRRASYAAPGFREQRGRSLKPDEREKALREIAHPNDALDLIARFPGRIMTPAQRFFEKLVAGQDIDVDKLMHAELLALREANRWAGYLSIERFTESQLKLAVDNAAAVSSIEHLQVEEFVGRENELNELRVFTGIRDRSLYAKVTDFARGGENQLLLIEGLGGIGKTALIGHFLFNNRGDTDGPLFPFAYLPCDDSSIDLRQGQSILIEAAGQFVRLVSIRSAIVGKSEPITVFERAYEDFVRATKAYGEARGQLTSRRSELESQEQRLESSRGQLSLLAEAFANLAGAACKALERPGGNTPPALLFIDTFEEVQYYAREQLEPFWNLFSQLFNSSSHIRLLISGRPPLATVPTSIRQNKIELVELEPVAAVELLHRETAMPREALDSVARQIGGNPLNLRLAARIVAEEGAQPGKGIVDLQTRRFGLFKLGPEVIRGRLYRRLLERIHDEDVRQLAHPGMVLRRVTPKIIEKVLAPLCGIAGVDEKRAIELFEALMAEHTLVRLDDDNSLRYREDVRAPVLSMLIAEDPQQTMRVHRLAMDFYRPERDAVSVAEFIYHGLMSGANHHSLDDAWRPDAARFLNTAISELPPEGTIWLATRMSLEIGPELRANADTAAWERIIGPEVLTLLEHRGSARALQLLDQRGERTPDSALFAIEARCLMSLGRAADANRLLQSALAGFPVHGNRGRRAELFWLLYQVRLSQSSRTEAVAALDDLIEIAKEMRSKLALVQALVTRIEHLREEKADASVFQGNLSKALLELNGGEIQREPDVVRSGVANLSEDAVGEARDVIRQMASSLFDLVANGRLQRQQRWIDVLRAMLEEAQQQPELERFRRYSAQTLADTAGTRTALPSLLETAIDAIMDGGDGRLSARQAYAARIIWVILQMETGTLKAATLAGLDEYQPDWRRAASATLAAV